MREEREERPGAFRSNWVPRDLPFAPLKGEEAFPLLAGGCSYEPNSLILPVCPARAKQVPMARERPQAEM